jgi:SAM-dependent methyltransferase
MFEVAADAYDRFMGRYSTLLAPQMADLAGVAHGQRAIDVGCGPGALTSELVRRLGADHVAAVDPSGSFVQAARQRHPGVDVRQASAEILPFPDGSFDAALAQLVVHFMADPVVAACVWDHAGGTGPLGLFWEVARALDPDTVDESNLAGAREGDLAELFQDAGLDDVRSSTVVARVEHPSFDAWWDPYTRGIGPAGAYVAGLDEQARDRLRAACRARMPDGPIVIDAVAWAARGVA